MVSTGLRRGTRLRAAVALGLAVALIAVPGMPPAAPPAIAQEEKPEEETAPPPSQPSTQQGEPKPSGPAPAFSPSGPGTGSGSGPGTGTGTAPGSGSAPGTGTGTGAGAPAPRPAASGTSALPPLGAPVYENALKDEKVFKAGYCFGRKAFTHYVGEGFKMRVMGPCHLLLDEAWITVEASGVTIGDGEVALDFKMVDGAERAKVGLYVRGHQERLIGAHVHPTRGEVSLFTLAGGTQTDLGYRNNVVMPPYEWNRLALRVSGYDTWLLVNDEPLLHTREVHADAGKVIIELIREGDVEDEAESAVVFRDLTLSPLEGGGPDRAPKGP